MDKIIASILFLFITSSISFAQVDSVLNTDSSSHHPKIGSYVPYFKKITEPTITKSEQVVYPERMKRCCIEGRVRLWALLDTLGRVEKIENDESSDPYPELVQSATNAILKTSFSPAKENGKPIRIWWYIPVLFKLNH